MGKLTGFMEYERREPPGRDPKTRVRDWQEFHEHLPEPTLKEQGARCMDCGVPFCHTGTVLPGGASGCPINNLIPEWNDLGLPRTVARGARAPAQDQQLPRVHRPRLPGAVRGIVRARDQRAGGHHQEHRSRHHRQGLRRGVGGSRTAGPAHRQEGGGGGIGARGAGLRGAAQPGWTRGDGLRARRSNRWPAHVRHPAHEAGQEHRRPAREAAGRRGGQVRHRRLDRQELRPPPICARRSTPWS